MPYEAIVINLPKQGGSGTSASSLNENTGVDYFKPTAHRLNDYYEGFCSQCLHITSVSLGAAGQCACLLMARMCVLIRTSMLFPLSYTILFHSGHN